MRRWALVGAVLVTAMAAAFASQSAQASKYLRVGIYDDAQTLDGSMSETLATYKQLHVQELRVDLYWGGPHGVAKSRPAHAADPADPAYDWSLYDQLDRYANMDGLHLLFTIYGTPSWENHTAVNHAPLVATDLRNFAIAAAKRYGGQYPDGQGGMLPPVREWLAWNEPNNPVFLAPQYKGKTIVSGVAYAKICNAVYQGVHATLIRSERVACGATAPRGNNDPSSSRPSVSPLAFLRAAKKGGLKTFDAWAHHPYYSSPSETPSTPPISPKGVPSTAVTLGNIGVLTKLVTQLYGNKRIWITEYGYQTNPPDPIVGVSYAKQAAYLKQAYAIARKSTRIDMMIWFLLRDEPSIAGWQSGLETVTGKHKPAFAAFQSLTK